MNKIKELLLKGPLPTIGMLAARILVGGYLTYLSYSLFIDRNKSGISTAVIYVFTVIFFLVGVFLCVKAIFSYVSGYYKGGKLDVEIEESADDVQEQENKIIDVEESEITELDN